MTDNEIEYTETDETYTELKSEEVTLSDALSEDCVECGAMLMWTLEPDPDSLCYTATCDQCGYRHMIQPTKAVIYAYDGDV